MTRERADRLLVARGLAESRTRAQALIAAGLVTSDARIIDRPGLMLAEDAPLALSGRDHPWVSRGGIKLAHALDHFGIDLAAWPKGWRALDIGSSTGGFTDVLLNRGAARVYAVDVGSDQLAPRLRADPRVVVHERTNARALTAEHIPAPVDLIVCDASFIALAKVLATPLRFAAPDAWLVALIKPQFEAERGAINKHGVVRDPAVHARVCADVAGWLASQGWRVIGTTPSPITGPAGNVEFLVAARHGTGTGQPGDDAA